MSTELEIGLDAASLAKFRRLLTANRTMAAKGLTFGAEKAQDAWRLENRRVFHLRGTGLNRGVGKTPATAANLQARVGSRDKFFSRHVIGLGGDKQGEDGRLLVPLYGDIGKAKTHTAFRRLLARMGGTFTFPDRAGDTLLARRLGKARAPLTMLAVLRRSVRIKPRFDAVAVVDRAVRQSFPAIYSRLLTRWAEQEG